MKSKSSFFSVAFLIVFIGLLTSEPINAQAWYDTDWQYRQTVTVANPTGTILTEFQVEITLDGSFDFSKAKNDGSDVRFTDTDGITLIPFWIEDWNAGAPPATIWIKVPDIPTTGTTVYMYYGNPAPTIPPPDPVETPPVGPFTRDPSNPINPIGDPGSGASLLAENIVYDDVSEHYWMVFANYRGGSQGVGLVWSDTPTDATSWNWHGNVYTHTGGGSFAPHIIKEDGLWYIFFATLPNIVYITSTTIDGTYSTPTVVLSPSETWETYRVDEPYVFQRNDGKWVMMYMGDIGSATEQVGYATADNITGPYTKYAGNPCIAFGPPGSYDAGTVADPWVYEYYGVYYIGYTVSPTTSSPWQTALATTTDWINFTKHGVIFPVAASGWDSNNSFRGAVTRIGDTYVFSYTGDSYKMGIATQPVFMSPEEIINNGDAVFDFFDDFEGTAIDLTKWTFASGSSSQTPVSGGLISLNASGTYVKINAQSSFGMDYMGETRAYHPNQGTSLLIAEVGFENNNWNTVRIVDDFMLGTTFWQRQAKLSGQPDAWVNMAQTADPNWHVFHIYRQSPNIAGFQIDDNPTETTTGDGGTSVPTMNLPPFLMSYGSGNQFVVDWTRVRKWAGADPTTLLGGEEFLSTTWNGTVNTDWNDTGNWSTDSPESYSKVTIPSAPVNQPHVIAMAVSPSQCDDLTIESGAVVTVDAGKALTVIGTLVNNAGNTGMVIRSDATGTGSLIEYSGVNATVERYLTDDKWHYISAPVDDPLAEVFLGIYMMEWDEPTGQWTYIIDPNYVMSTDMKGYGIWTLDIATVSFTGNLNTGAKSFNTTNTFGALHNNKGFNFSGNPYPSSLNWNVDDGTGWTRIAGNTDLTLYIWNHDEGNYGVYVKDGFTGTLDVDSIIPPHQGFIVHCSAAIGYIGVDNGARVHASKDILKEGLVFTEPMLKLKVEGNSYADEILFRIEPLASAQYDNLYDALKYRGEEDAPQLYSVSKDNLELSVNAFPDTEEYKIIPLGLEVGMESIYTISVSVLSGFDLENNIYLEDLKTGTFTKIETNSSYSFTASPFDEPMRFLLHLNGELDVPEYSNELINIYSLNKIVYIEVPENTKGSIAVYNIMGQKIVSTSIGDVLTKIAVDKSAYYVVKVVSDEGVVARKVFVR